MASSNRAQPTLFMEAFAFIELVYYTTVREIRTESGNATFGLLLAVSRVLVMVAMFYALYAFLGMRSAVVRGDMVLFLVSGVVMFLMHNSAVGRTVQAGSAVSAMMQHAPMTPTLMIVASGLAALYLNLLAVVIILSVLFFARGALHIHDPIGLMLPFILAWASGIVVGLLFLMLKPFAPSAMRTLSLVYRRANLITSGKFFVANMLPNMLFPFFAWNPLFHCIDQARGAMFVNYVPNKTSLDYPLKFVAVGIVIGMMGEFWLRRKVSKSTGAAN